MNRYLLLPLALLALPLSAADALARLDASAAGLRTVVADLKRTTHTAVINEDATESGNMVMWRGKPGEVRVLIRFQQPDQRDISLSGRKVEIFVAKANQVQEYDLGKQRQLVDQFLLLGFGSTSRDLRKSYDIQIGASDTVSGKTADRLLLTPKTKAAQEHLQKVELWVDESGMTVQQKFFLPSGDYTLVTYNNVRRNPELKADALELKMPKGVERVRPQK